VLENGFAQLLDLIIIAASASQFLKLFPEPCLVQMDMPPAQLSRYAVHEDIMKKFREKNNF